MSSIPGVGPTLQQAPSSAGGLENFDSTEFLRLMITALQNQDPLDPMDNSEILAQIGQIRSISASDQLRETLASVLTGQNLATASGLIGKEVRALSDNGSDVVGVVDKVSIEVDPNDDSDRSLKIHIGSQQFDIDNIREIIGSSIGNV